MLFWNPSVRSVCMHFVFIKFFRTGKNVIRTKFELNCLFYNFQCDLKFSIFRETSQYMTQKLKNAMVSHTENFSEFACLFRHTVPKNSGADEQVQLWLFNLITPADNYFPESKFDQKSKTYHVNILVPPANSQSHNGQ